MRYTLLLILSILSFHSSACSCIGEYSVKEQMKKSKLVFSGKLINKTRIDIKDTISNIGTDAYPVWNILEKPMFIYEFEVHSRYKGRIKTKKVNILTGSGDMCGLQFEVDHNYIIYAEQQKEYFPQGKRVKKFLYSDSCSRSCEQNDVEINAIKKTRRFTRTPQKLARGSSC